MRVPNLESTSSPAALKAEVEILSTIWLNVRSFFAPSNKSLVPGIGSAFNAVPTTVPRAAFLKSPPNNFANAPLTTAAEAVLISAFVCVSKLSAPIALVIVPVTSLDISPDTGDSTYATGLVANLSKSPTVLGVLINESAPAVN